jgi:PKD domain
VRLGKRVARFTATAAIGVVCLLTFSPVPAAAASPAGRPAGVSAATMAAVHRPRGIVPRWDKGAQVPSVPGGAVDHPGFSNPQCTMCAPPLVFHTGVPVMGSNTGQIGHVTITPIYWNPTGSGLVYTPTYKSVINTYLQNVAAASNQNSNVFSVSTQYYQKISGGANQYIQYVVSAGALANDTDAYPPALAAGHCTADPTYAYCITDAQLQTELAAFLTTNLNDANLYMVFFPNTVETCFVADGQPNQACSSTGFCGYHSGFGITGSNPPFYANEPFPSLTGCGPVSGTQAPNGDAFADAEISIVSHEANESITDAYGAWYDSALPSGFENGDECGYTYGISLGGTPGALYNQVINGAHYYTQDEFSNEDYARNLGDPVSDTNATIVRGCVQKEELPTAAFPVPPPITAGASTTFNGGTSFDPDNNAPLVAFSWNWGDGTAPSSGVSPSHTFNSVSTFNVTLTVTDIGGWSDSTSHSVAVLQRGPVAQSAGNGPPGSRTVDQSPPLATPPGPRTPVTQMPVASAAAKASPGQAAATVATTAPAQAQTPVQSPPAGKTVPADAAPVQPAAPTAKATTTQANPVRLHAANRPRKVNWLDALRLAAAVVVGRLLGIL